MTYPNSFRLPRPVPLVLLLGLLLLPSNSAAEMYAAGMVGYTAPNDLTNIQGTGVASGISLSDLELKSSVAYGGKIGYFFPGVNWLGIETELYNTTPHVKQQSVTASGFGVTVPLGTAPGFNLRVLTWGINAVVRYPGNTFQPYAGVGLGVFFAEAKFQGQSESDTAPGLNALAGMRLFATDHLALFAEYKYNRATFNLPNVIGFEADYSANIFMGGVSYHF
ncbi:MAG TPA: outer membrane beta-barrel protein [Blastocatellia bacterium]|nr:outer membrane beta-barrel protein [Blastocatellia bacterium]